MRDEIATDESDVIFTIDMFANTLLASRPYDPATSIVFLLFRKAKAEGRSPDEFLSS